jgi:acyl carrier protein
MKEKIKNILINILQDINEDLEDEMLINPTDDTKLFGESGVLDSLALVSVVTDLEEEIHDEFDKHITLADEKAMSQKSSPFSTVETLTEYIYKLIHE